MGGAGPGDSDVAASGDRAGTEKPRLQNNRKRQKLQGSDDSRQADQRVLRRRVLGSHAPFYYWRWRDAVQELVVYTVQPWYCGEGEPLCKLYNMM